MFRITSKLTRQNYLLNYVSVKKLPQVRTAKCPPPPASLCPPPKKSASTGSKYTIGAIMLVTGATIAYAKYDYEFRQLITGYIPYSEEFFKFLFQEEKSYYESIVGTLSSMVESLGSGDLKDRKRNKPEEPKDYFPPRPVFPQLDKGEKKEEAFNEIRVATNEDDVEIVLEKPKPEPEFFGPTHPKTMSELEAKISLETKTAIEAYSNALNALRSYNRDIEQIVEGSIDKIEGQIWQSLKVKTENKNVILREAQENADDAVKNMKRLRELIDDPMMEAPDSTKATVKRNLDRLTEDINKAKVRMEEERKASNITEKYWKKVYAARCHFIEELEILFPEFDINRKPMSLSQSDIDLFILHAFANVMYFQKEMHKAETIGTTRLKYALEAVKKNDPNFTLKQVQVQEEVEKQKRQLELEYQKRCLALRQNSERELRRRLKMQAEAHSEHLSERLTAQQMELEREYNKALDEQLMHEQQVYKTQLAGLVGRMKGMTQAMNERMQSDEITRQSQVLWSACQSLHRAVRGSTPGQIFEQQIRPLRHEVEAIQLAAAEGDELVEAVLTAIPEEAVERGVFPEDTIRERFLKVEAAARRLALIPEEGGALPLYFLSFLQSMLLVNAYSPIPQAELANEVVDFGKLDTFDVLQRARYWVDRGNFAQTLRYMNLLQGASRCIASQWMNETRILLETQQAAEALMAHAVASGLEHL